jgi:hypothetical protein
MARGQFELDHAGKNDTHLIQIRVIWSRIINGTGCGVDGSESASQEARSFDHAGDIAWILRVLTKI